MQVKVIVTLKPSVLDPQGLTVQRNLETAGISGVTNLRQGKYFEVELSDGGAGGSEPTDQMKTTVERLAKDVLTNPVIEDYRIVWESQ